MKMSNFNSTTTGHLAASFTALVWGITFVSSKVLLESFQPIELMFYRFLLGLITLLLIHPHVIKPQPLKSELLFLGAGFFGVTFYFLLENIALTYTYAANVSVIISIVPCFTAIASWLFLKDEGRPGIRFFAGFVIAIVGIIMISFNGTTLQLNPLGDALTVAAAAVWAVYNIFYRRAAELGFHLVETTQRIFFYALLTMMPFMWFFDFEWGFERLTNWSNLGNLCFLGILASAVCYLTWNYAVNCLGTIKTSIYIYAQPVVTVVFSVIILGEKITPLYIFGIILTLVGLILSQMVVKKRTKKKKFFKKKK